MKTSSKIILAIGCILLILQIMVYSGRQSILPNYDGNISIYLGRIIGSNLFGILGILLIIISLSRNHPSKSNQ